MAQSQGEPLDITSLRYWQQNAQMAVRDVYDALVELITNADDRYVLLKTKMGRIEIEVERKRKGTPNTVRLRDFADGMTLADMRRKLKRVGDRVSGMEKGKPVRGTNSRGAKDVAILGGVTFESFAADGCYHKCEITRQGRFKPSASSSEGLALHRVRLNLPEGTGTVVTISVDPDIYPIPQHDKLRQNLRQLVVLRDILGAQDREVSLSDMNQGRKDLIVAPVANGKERVNERFAIPGYSGVEAKINIKRAKERFDDHQLKFRLGGILVKSKHAIHEATLFAPELENDPNAKWFFGRLTCDHIDVLSNEYDNRFEQGLSALPSNPRPIVDPLRKEGLIREHPFVDALFKEALKRLRPLIEEERKQAESNQAKIESDDTRKRLGALEKAAAKFIREHQEDQEVPRDADDSTPGSGFEKKGYALNPPFAQIMLGQSLRFWLNIRQEAFPELAVGDTVAITCATDEISSSKRFGALEIHPNRENVLRCVWTVKGERPTKATAIKVQVGPIVAESAVEVLEDERERYQHIETFCFSRKKYSVQVASRRAVILYAPCPAMVSESMPIEIECADAAFKVSGNRTLVPHPEWGVAVCKLGLSSSMADRHTTLTATMPGYSCEAEAVSTQPVGATIKIELKDKNYGNQRYYWRGNVLEIGARHPALLRYLGSAPDFAGQEQKHFRVLLAEIAAEAVCSRLISRKETDDPEEYTDSDWDAYYAEYTMLLTKFLPIAHETQVRG